MRSHHQLRVDGEGLPLDADCQLEDRPHPRMRRTQDHGDPARPIHQVKGVPHEVAERVLIRPLGGSLTFTPRSKRRGPSRLLEWRLDRSADPWHELGFADQLGKAAESALRTAAKTVE
jgi:hypothetical protein